ncbi:hypothetical protein ACP4OV_010520 [Aristida adscensionis]
MGAASGCPLSSALCAWRGGTNSRPHPLAPRLRASYPDAPPPLAPPALRVAAPAHSPGPRRRLRTPAGQALQRRRPPAAEPCTAPPPAPARDRAGPLPGPAPGRAASSSRRRPHQPGPSLLSMAWTATETATASLCCRLVRLPSARRPPRAAVRCSAAHAQSPYAVDLNLWPLYPNVSASPFSVLPFFPSPHSCPLICLRTQRGHHMRIRQHANPLSSFFSEPTEPLE